METINKKVSCFIKQKRLALGLTQQQFAELIFGDTLKSKWISDIENGRKNITVTTLDRILKKINCEINFIEH